MKEKSIYTVKAWDGKDWTYFPSIYLNPFDTWDDKLKVIASLKEKYGKHYQFNISNFSNVYC
jgi:hypothetical protein